MARGSAAAYRCLPRAPHQAQVGESALTIGVSAGALVSTLPFSRSRAVSRILGRVNERGRWPLCDRSAWSGRCGGDRTPAQKRRSQLARRRCQVRWRRGRADTDPLRRRAPERGRLRDRPLLMSGAARHRRRGVRAAPGAGPPGDLGLAFQAVGPSPADTPVELRAGGSWISIGGGGRRLSCSRRRISTCARRPIKGASQGNGPATTARDFRDRGRVTFQASAGGPNRPGRCACDVTSGA